jgi:hypothetical protein
MSKPVVIKLKNPIYGGGALTDRAVLYEKIFTEQDHGKDYQSVAKEWATTNVSNVAHIDGLDDASEKIVNIARKKAV